MKKLALLWNGVANYRMAEDERGLRWIAKRIAYKAINASMTRRREMKVKK